MTQLQKVDKTVGEVATVQDMSGGLLEVIARAARDPNVDIDKMERLLQMQERVQARNAQASFAAALAELQPKLPIISERGKILNKQGGTQSKYALWEDINEAIRPLLAEHGFSLSFKGRSAGAMIVTVGILSHRDGHSETTEIELPRDDSGSKNAVQGIGSSKSYGKRYAAFDLLNITTRGEDDDGVRGGAAPTLSDDQQANVQALMEDVGADRKRFLDYVGVASIADILATDYQKALRALEAKRGK